MKCNKAAQLISKGVLDNRGIEFAELQEHAAHCNVCYIELKTYELIMSEVSDMVKHEAPPNLHSNIMSHIVPKQVSCDTVQALLSAVYDNELYWSDSDVVNAHVKDCASCASDRVSIEAIAAGIHHLDINIPPVYLRAQILKKIHRPVRTVNIADWMMGTHRFRGLGVVMAVTLLCAFIYANLSTSNQPNVTSPIYMGSSSITAPLAPGRVSIMPKHKTSSEDIATNKIHSHLSLVAHSHFRPIYRTVTANEASTVKVAYNHRSIDTAKAVSLLFKKPKYNKLATDARGYSVIPDADQIKYNLEAHEPVNMESEPEVVASAAGGNVNGDYEGGEQYFTKVAEKVQSKNRLDEWLEKSKTFTEEAKLSRKSANIQLLGFKF